MWTDLLLKERDELGLHELIADKEHVAHR